MPHLEGNHRKKVCQKKEKDKANHLLRLEIFIFIGLIGYILIMVINVKSLGSSINSNEIFAPSEK